MKITNRLLFHVVAGAAIGTGGLLVSQIASAHRADGQQMFQMMDTNSDGKISTEEHAAGAEKMFDKMDANKDGKVTAAEMDAAHEQIAGKSAKPQMSSAEKIKMVDTNGDGVLSREEHVAGAKMMFDKMDTDKDGFLSKAEFDAGHAKLMSKPR